jgi:hypothetical protein
MTVVQRNIFAASADNGMPNAAAVRGGDNSLDDRGPEYAAPISLGDQESPQTAGERAGLVSSFTEAREAAAKFDGVGAYGVAIGGQAAE